MIVDIIRVFNAIVFMFAAGLAVAMAFYLKTAYYRKLFLLSFASLCIGTFTGNIIGITEHRPWHWASSPFILLASILTIAAVIIAWKERKLELPS